MIAFSKMSAFLVSKDLSLSLFSLKTPALHIEFDWPTTDSVISLVLRNPVFGVPDQVRHKLGCAVTENG